MAQNIHGSSRYLPPETAGVHVLLDDGNVRSPDRSVGDGSTGNVGSLGSHGETKVVRHLSQDTVDDADKVSLGGGQGVDVTAAGEARLDIDVDTVKVVGLEDGDDGGDELVGNGGAGQVDGGGGTTDGHEDGGSGGLGLADLIGGRDLHAGVHTGGPLSGAVGEDDGEGGGVDVVSVLAEDGVGDGVPSESGVDTIGRTIPVLPVAHQDLALRSALGVAGGLSIGAADERGHDGQRNKAGVDDASHNEIGFCFVIVKEKEKGRDFSDLQWCY